MQRTEGQSGATASPGARSGAPFSAPASASASASSSSSSGSSSGASSGSSRRASAGDTAEAASTLAATLAATLVTRLTTLGKVVSTAESCTGGLVAGAITSVPGSSAAFETGFVTYSNESKTRLLGVAADTLARHGAVSEAVVREMAAGACRQADADVGVAISGVAGPDGGSPDKPVGTVWLAWALRHGPTRTACHHFSGNRDAVRLQAVDEALRGTVAALVKQP